MLKEALASADAVAAQLADTSRVEALAARLAEAPRDVALTVARGSSDHAASYFASLTMSRLGVPVASLPMSVATLQQAPLRVRGQLAIAFSQSGKSPDLIGTMVALRDAGALTVAAVNAPGSPLAAACEWDLPLSAGPELSVAATKSYIAMLSLSAQLVAHWQRDEALLGALRTLPDALRAAGTLDWSSAVEELRGVERMIVIGRGLGLAIAQEAALKLKETSGIQAEAFSSAEVRHGPMELIDRDYPLLVFAPRGPEQEGLVQLARDMKARGARVLLAAPDDVAEATLPVVQTAHPALDPIATILSFYVMAAALAAARGRNPDAPRHLNKVTETH
ncbi:MULTISPECIES: SIS domain-containing protein [Paraburkholderia]|uniref:SIS domain-containing protein n=1 Tax=Paraburkholderia TaxID=1822464 RepID=UPI0022528155|nr:MULTISPECIES: SIS domain-containing protein [Paraburkholderia]MCX4160520.1 SIS domain-containing protein [Paraburkholderia megapolitana]MDN7156018.1 SIS domain-containing protein [Paraburkholderia sp. CHISQ3]MDQ6493062.1 SIS domain-containing protein [Paraburkholderia megapolitana]